MVDNRRDHIDAGGRRVPRGPGRAFWSLVLVVLPWAGIAVVTLLLPDNWTLTRFTPPGYFAAAAIASAALLGLLLFRLPLGARLGWAACGGFVSGVAALCWLGAFAVLASAAECLPDGCP